MKNKILSLCDYYCKTNPPESIRWGWGEGLITYALMKLDEYHNDKRYFDYVKRYVLYHYNKGIKIDSSDTVCPCLASLELYKVTHEEVYKDITKLGVDYIINSKKILEDIPNHFGFGRSSSYPQSIWVDSLMMFSVFSSLYALEFNDDNMMAYAAKMPAIFSKYLQNENGLWHHSYWVDKKMAYPKNLFWGRGNGWVCLSFPLIKENCNLGKEIDVPYVKTIDAMANKQCKDGSFKTILNHFESYKETSATALFAAGVYKAISMGLLDASYKEYADKAYNYLDKKLVVKENGTFLKDISRGTIPHTKIPYTYYMILKKASNYNYGIAAMIFAYIFKNDDK